FILHLVEVTAVLELETPTGPLTAESVQVSPVPSARTEKPAAAPRATGACAATGHAPASTANETSRRKRNLRTTRFILDLLRGPCGPGAGSICGESGVRVPAG